MNVTNQAPLSMGFSSQEYWSGVLFPPPWDPLDPGIKPASPALAGRYAEEGSPGNKMIKNSSIHNGVVQQ